MRRQLQLQHPTAPLPGDSRLYILDGVTAKHIDDSTHEHTLRRWRAWRHTKHAAEELSSRIKSLSQDISSRHGGLLQAWGPSYELFVLKYHRLNRAMDTRLPLTSTLFESRTGLSGVSAAEYRRILTGTDPVVELAEAYQTDIKTIEALEANHRSDIEYTFLHRVIRIIIAERSIADRLRMILDMIEEFLEWSHGTFHKTRVTRHGVGYTLFSLRLHIADLESFVDYIDTHSKQLGGNPSAVVLSALEAIWGIPVTEEANEYLNVVHRRLSDIF